MPTRTTAAATTETTTTTARRTTAMRSKTAAMAGCRRALRAQRCVSMLAMLMLLLIVHHTNAAANGVDDTPARVLAQQTGATQFEEERYDAHKDCAGGEHKHHLQKRASDEDIDYEVYQGVVGRPGIDFPIYPRIPKTSFSCRSFGNGYFADMETDCQVFHICEDGRKISFLCPNGTIFQQSELTCDWWFKVNCLGSPGYYAESSEILSKQRLQRLRPAVPVQGFNIVGGGLNIKPKISNAPATQSRSRANGQSGKNERRVDSIEQHSLETIDFDDLSAEKQLKGQPIKVISNIDDNSNNGNSNDNDETQLTAESASFVGANRRSGYTYEKGNGDVQRKAAEGRNAVRNDLGSSRRGISNVNNGKNANGNNNGSAKNSNSNGTNFGNSKNGSTNGNSNGNGNGSGSGIGNGNVNSGNKNYNSGTKNGNGNVNGFANTGNNGNSNNNNNNNGNGAQKTGFAFGHGKPFSNESSGEKARPPTGRGQQRYRDEKKQVQEVSSRNSGGSAASANVRDTKKYEKTVDASGSFEGSIRSNDFTGTTETLAPIRGIDKSQQFTSAPGTYSTARRLDATRTTPFYTPTVPSISKIKTTESKTYYVKTTKNNNNIGIATTPNPNRISTGTGSSLFLESSVGTTPNLISSETTRATLRPFIIGMRHDYGDLTSTELYRIPLVSKNNFNFEQSIKGNINAHLNANAVTEHATTLSSVTTPRTPTTGPTYLPKNAAKPTTGFDAAGDDFLFAPIPTVGDPVARNVDDMLKTMNLLKEELNDVEVTKYQGGAREGLEIPPSSGPDVLVSLAKYFAGEENSKKNSISDSSKQQPQKLPKLTVPTTTRIPLTQKEESVIATIVASKPSDTTTSITIPSSSEEVQVKSDDIRAGLLREKTLSQYSNLFGLKDPKAKQGPVDPSEGLLSHVTESAIISTKSTAGIFPQIGSTDATIRELAEKPDSRKIAQVFSNALTTYLEDPKSFREQLVSVRPTEPPATNRPNFTPVTVTDSTLFNRGTAATYLPSKPTPAGRSRPVTTTDRTSIAAEINSKLETSTVDVSVETTTFTSLRDGKSSIDLSAELIPPTFDSGEGDEFLQREQTQSFVKSRNELSSGKAENGKKAEQKLGVQGNPKTTENPWVHISQTDFLDPLTINDGLMRESTTTPSPFTYLPTKSTTALPLTTTTTATPTTTTFLPTTGTPTTTRVQTSQRLEQQNNGFVGSAEFTTSRSVSNYRSLENGADGAGGSGYGGSIGFGGISGRSNINGNSWQDIFETYDIPRESLPSNNGLQRIANKLFGGLNETEALHLKNVMLQAEHNRQVLGLLLLLIQTCDDQNGKALERSRKHLLNALIDMDGKLASEEGKTSYDKPATTTRVPPVTTYRRNTDEYLANTTPFSPTELPLSVTTTFANFGASVEETTKFEIRVVDPEDEDAATSAPASLSPSSSVSAKQPIAGANSSDKRALELLKSLYSLASKFSSRR